MSDFNIRYVDVPMACCGMMEGYGFNKSIHDGTYRTLFGGTKLPNYREPTQQDHEDRLTQLIKLSGDANRNCCIIVLADYQKPVIEAAERLGFTKIQTFWNPNTGRNCHIMTYLHFGSKETYAGEWDDSEGDYDDEGYDEEDDE